ncbi:GNAT family N-acetyltransferase [Streptomyces sp. NBC_00576]|uniref:GNAT family N-acetyltransferase n=1 Tax=Streptomyces sp. NBC_00576 TaxID=2903665 RepID=UPI002E80B41C|nr:GNAT family N-acetyltransferase [Streptomyces sp. NBC_00576]WUB70017.1 GNAT family N-acetyltransferase [Streptomyces sp. NBC_00576]
MPAAHQGVLPAAENRAKWQAGTRALSDERCLLLAEQNGELRGFIHLDTSADGRVHVDDLHARLGRLDAGVGRILLHLDCAWAARRHPGRDVCLEVLRGNARAISFYERAGGLRTAERPLRMDAGFTRTEIDYT